MPGAKAAESVGHLASSEISQILDRLNQVTRPLRHGAIISELRHLAPATQQRFVSKLSIADRKQLLQAIQRWDEYPSLTEFIPAVSRTFTAPHHLVSLTSVFHQISGGASIRVVSSVPPRHGKTETILHGIAWLLRRAPSLQVAYVAHSSQFAHTKSERMREIARSAGVPISTLAWSKKYWKTGIGEGGVWATGIDGGIMGMGFHLIVVDDPYTSPEEANSPAERAHVVGMLEGTLINRLEPNGSVIVNMTRYHPDDIAGYCIKRGWERLNIPAISDSGYALWPQQWPVERLQHRRAEIGEFYWASQYMGEPRPQGACVFDRPVFYDQLPTENWRLVIGVDFAYTQQKYSDYSAAVVALEHHESAHDDQGNATATTRFYVLKVVRVQVKAPEFGAILQGLQQDFPEAITVGYVGGTELGVVDFLRGQGLHITAMPAKSDKFARAQPVAAAWNNGNILLPSSKFLQETRADGRWLPDFVREVTSFTGVADDHDDQVDALAGAFAGVGKQWGPQEWAQYEEFADALPRAGLYN
jgi:predicted phage terminase large subunit-like protein